MKVTIDIPDSLYRQVKTRSAMEGRSVRDVTIELFRGWLALGPPAGSETARDRMDAAETWLASWDEVGARIERAAVDERTTRDILTADRR
jgi:hypothetical protein